MKTLYLLTLFAILTLPVKAATIAGGILNSTDTTGTNARPSRVTISPLSGGTNLLAGAIAVTNNLTVGNNAAITGALLVTGQITNSALQASEMVYASSTKVLGSISPGNVGDVLTSAGAGVAPSFTPPTGGGDTIWTNISGTITADSTNGVSYTLDGGSLSDYSGTLYQGLIGTNRTFRVQPNGGLALGSSVDESGEYNEDIGAIEISRSIANGDVSTTEIYMENKDSTDYNFYAVFQADVGAVTDGSFSHLNLDAQNNASSVYRLILNSQEGANEISMGKSGGPRLVKFVPDAVDGTPSSVLDTSVTHTSGNFFTVGNHGTNKVAFAVNSTTDTTPLLLWDPDNATLTQVTLGTNNSGGTGFRVLRLPNK